MSVIRRRFGRIAGAVGLAAAILVVVGLAVRPGSPRPASPSVDVNHRCSIENGRMTAIGTVRNRQSEPVSVRLVWRAVSSAEFDPPIERGYSIALTPGEELQFEHPIVSADSIANDIVVDGDYTCSLTVE